MTKPWRDVYEVHPAADLFPLMIPGELKALGEDIKQRGMCSPVFLWEADKGKKIVLLDGRNRLDAMEAVGIPILDDRGLRSTMFGGPVWIEYLRGPGAHGGVTGPYEFVLSANVHRRHLTAEQKRELIAKVLKAQPEKSNRTIAKQTKADHKTVGKVRGDLEATGDIPQLSKTTGADGKARTTAPAKKKRRTADDFVADRKARKAAKAEPKPKDPIQKYVQQVRDVVLRAKQKIPEEDWIQLYCDLADAIDDIFPSESAEIERAAVSKAEAVA